MTTEAEEIEINILKSKILTSKRRLRELGVKIH